MKGMLAAFVWSITPAYFLVGWLFRTQWIEKREVEDESEVSFLWIAAFVFFVTMLIVYAFSGLKTILVTIEVLIGDSFEKLSEGDAKSSFEIFKRIFVSAANVNVAFEVLSCSHPQIRLMFENALKFLKWAIQHIINLIAVMSLYYACYTKNSEKGNLLLLALTCEIYILWFIRDIFEAVSTRLHVNGFVLEAIYGSEIEEVG